FQPLDVDDDLGRRSIVPASSQIRPTDPSRAIFDCHPRRDELRIPSESADVSRGYCPGAGF
ncbi:hypothetical protein GWI33_002222, partial [Rhynchophorus ferrugineus]